jgi:hypothetical protein
MLCCTVLCAGFIVSGMAEGSGDKVRTAATSRVTPGGVTMVHNRVVAVDLPNRGLDGATATSTAGAEPI